MAFSFIKRIFSEKKDPLDSVEAILGYKFKNRELLKVALTHRSWDNGGTSNERLEFLGDAVLGLLVSEFLYDAYPNLNEGDLTKMKSSLVNEAVLARVFARAGLSGYLFLSREEEKSGGRDKPSITADAMEAVLGAVFLDGGIDNTSRIIERLLFTDYENLMNDESTRNYKGELLELVQLEGRGVPRYEVIEEIGPDHEKIFVVSVSVESETIGTGRGTTKKEAEQRAARMALAFLNKDSNMEK